MQPNILFQKNLLIIRRKKNLKTGNSWQSHHLSSPEFDAFCSANCGSDLIGSNLTTKQVQTTFEGSRYTGES